MESEKARSLETRGQDGDGAANNDDVASLQQENADLRQRVAELKAHAELAFSDPLTGLGNRRYLEKRLAEEINRIGRERGSTFSLLLIDVDDFKRINDAYGHIVGDEALRWVARFIVGSVREHDVCCRPAGDEFVVILPGADGTSCAQLIDRLRQRLSSVRSWSGVPLSLSVGQATYGEDGVAPGALVAAADRRMYADKRAHKASECGCSSEAAWSALLAKEAIFSDPSLEQLSLHLVTRGDTLKQ